MVSSFQEDLPHHQFEHAEQYAVETARHKAMDVARLCAAQQDKPPVDLIISADTVRPQTAEQHHRQQQYNAMPCSSGQELYTS